MLKNSFLTLIFIFVCFFGFCQTKIGQDIDGESANSSAGHSVSISSDGSIVAIGLPTNSNVNGSNAGQVRVYENISGVWTQMGQDIYGETTYSGSGIGVSLSDNGSIVAIGALPFSNANGNFTGMVRVYQYISGIWTQIGQDINGETAGSGASRVSLSYDGSIVAVGEPFDSNVNGGSAGQVRVYQNISGVWTQIGQDIHGQSANSFSGGSISLSNNGSIIAIAGNGYNNSTGSMAGQVIIYQYDGALWVQIGQNIDGEINDGGRSVSLSDDGSIVAIGANGNSNENGMNSGLVRVYQNISGVWTQIGQDIYGESVNSGAGRSVSLSNDGNILAIGENLDSNGNGINAGQVQVYQNISGVWTQIGQDINGESANSGAGSSVSLSYDGTILAIGASNNSNDNGISAGQVRVYDLTAVLSSDEFVLSNFKIFPNPANNQFTIQLKESLILEKVNIYNSLGQFLNTTQEKLVNTSELSSGMYYVEVITNQGKATQKLVVE